MAGGNYGGMSTPTTPVGGSDLLAGKITTYKDYLCTTIVASGGSASFGYKGVSYSIGAAGEQIEMVVSPTDLTAVNNVYFLCYKCTCDGPMTGTTDASVASAYNNSFYSGRTPIQQVTFLGMGANQN